MKKVGTSIAIALICIIATSSFLSPKPRRNRHQVPSECEEPPAQKPATAQAPSIAAYNASSRNDVNDSWDVYFTADFIYWQARADGLDYGVTTENPPTLALFAEPPVNGKVLNTDFDYHPGVKLGIGGLSEYDDWDLYIEWTHLVSHNNTSSTIPDEGGLIYPSLNYPDQPMASRDRAFMSWRCIYNTIDLELGRSYYLGKYWSVRPFGGIRGSWIRQSYNAQYNDMIVQIFQSELTEIGTGRISSKYNTWGLGPRLGWRTDWLLGWGFKMFQNISFCLQWVKPSETKTEHIPLFPNRPLLSCTNKKGSGVLRPNMDLDLGLGWGCYFDNYNWHVDLSLAYEFNYWWDHNFDLFFSDDFALGHTAQRGDLYLHGVTFRVRFDF